MCLKIKEWPSNGTSCCYNHYYNGTTCVPCRPGPYGQDCDKNCSNGSYGHLYSTKCQCPVEFCSPGTGCSADYSINSTAHVSYLNTYASKHITLISTEITKTSHVSRNIFSTLSLTANVPKFTENHNSTDINIFMMSISGVTALFLGILMIQLCIKCFSKRNNNSEQVSSNSERNEGQDEEECYAEINESMMAERRYDGINEHLQLEKYFQLQRSSSHVAEPYDIMNQLLPNRERTSSSILSTCFESNASNLLYLKPNNYINGEHSYLDVMGSSPANEVALIQSSLIQIADNSDPHSSFHYTDPY